MKKIWLVYDDKIGFLRQGQGYQYTQNIDEARIFNRKCDASNSVTAMKHEYIWDHDARTKYYPKAYVRAAQTKIEMLDDVEKL